MIHPLLLACRPKTLWAGICPVILGGILAWHHHVFALWPWLAAALAALFIQIGTNFANDYFDFIKGADTADRIGPTRATQAGLIKPQHMKNAFIAAFGIAACFGLYLVAVGGLPILMIGLLSIVCGILYTGGPFPLAYMGLGDLFVLIFFGPIAVAGTVYVQSGSWSPEAWLLGLAPGLFSVAILAINNLRDLQQDRIAHKKTLAVRFGKRTARLEITLALVLGSAIPFLIHPTPVHALPLLTLIPALPILNWVWRQEGAILNQALARTGQLLLLFTALTSIAWALQ
ncbi:MAG: 1,4-dihydroxy-2-naphthoate polyprenyltransferase [Candidatus Margulisiibacteriota bacterium]